MNTEGLKKGDTIKCANDADLRNTLKALGDEGYNAVTWNYDQHVVMITKAPQP